MRAVYGPVASWRLGISLGIDPICELKVCSFDCVYCQCGKTTRKTIMREAFVNSQRMEHALNAYPYVSHVANVATFSGSGEPALNKQLGSLIEVVRKVTNLPIAILTNSSLMPDPGVRRDFRKADIVIAKLDAPNPRLFQQINDPHPQIDFGAMVEGMISFRDEFRRKYALQLMFMKQNKFHAKELRELAEQIQPDEIQINTPTRANEPCLSRKELQAITKAFQGTKYISYYEARKLRAVPFNRLATLKRRPE